MFKIYFTYNNNNNNNTIKIDFEILQYVQL